MRSKTRSMALMLVVWTLIPGATTPAAAQQAQEAGVAALWAQLDEYWNGRNAQRFSEVFTTDASLQFVDAGLTLEGRDNILQHFSKQFPTFAADILHETSVTTVHHFAGDVGGVDARVRILRDTDGSAKVLRTYSIFAVMLETREGLRIHVLRAYLLPAESKPDATANSISRLSIPAGP